MSEHIKYISTVKYFNIGDFVPFALYLDRKSHWFAAIESLFLKSAYFSNKFNYSNALYELLFKLPIHKINELFTSIRANEA